MRNASMKSVGNAMPFWEPGGRPARRRDFARVTVAGASGATVGIALIVVPPAGETRT